MVPKAVHLCVAPHGSNDVVLVVALTSSISIPCKGAETVWDHFCGDYSCQTERTSDREISPGIIATKTLLKPDFLMTVRLVRLSIPNQFNFPHNTWQELPEPATINTEDVHAVTMQRN